MATIDPLAIFTLDQFKAFLNVPLDDVSKDEALALIGAGASQAAEEWMNRRVRRRPHVETFNGPRVSRVPAPMSRVFLSNFPVVGVTAVERRERADRAWESLSVDAIAVDPQTGLLELLDATIPPGLQTLRISYDAGFDPVPSAYLLDALELAKWIWQRWDQNVITAQQINLGTHTLILSNKIPADLKQRFDSRRPRRF